MAAVKTPVVFDEQNKAETHPRKEGEDVFRMVRAGTTYFVVETNGANARAALSRFSGDTLEKISVTPANPAKALAKRISKLTPEEIEEVKKLLA